MKKKKLKAIIAELQANIKIKLKEITHHKAELTRLTLLNEVHTTMIANLKKDTERMKSIILSKEDAYMDRIRQLECDADKYRTLDKELLLMQIAELKIENTNLKDRLAATESPQSPPDPQQQA